MTLPSPRTSHYESSNIEIIRTHISKVLGDIEERIGFFPVSVQSNLLGSLTKYELSLIFLQMIFDLVIILLVIISVLLIYSLLLQNIETKSFEIGV